MTMTVRDLVTMLNTEILKDNKRANWPISVSFRWKGETVVSDIVSVNINGNSIQLNEEDFMRHATLLHELGYDTGVIKDR